MNNSYKDLDTALINLPNLKWLPWIGKNFFTNPKRLLIVGESQYANGTSEDEFIADLAVVNHIDFTRNMIQQTQIQNIYVHKPLNNLLKTLFVNDRVNNEKLWENISFYNFIQRPLDYRKNAETGNPERPLVADFDQGWETFVEVVKILEPTDCIFIGVEAATSVERMMDQLQIKRGNRQMHPMINNTSPRTIEVFVSKQAVKVSFIKHSSKFFSPEAWHPFLETQHSDLIKLLLQKAKE